MHPNHYSDHPHSSHINQNSNLAYHWNPWAGNKDSSESLTSVKLGLAPSCNSSRVNTERIIVYFITSYRHGHWLLLEVTKEEKKLSRS